MIVKNCRCSFPTLFTPRSVGETDPPKYGITVMFDKENEEHMAAVKEIQAEQERLLKEKWPKGKPKKLNLPLKDGDSDDNDREEYEGHFTMSLRSSAKPGVVDQRLQPVSDEQLIRPGDYVNVSFNMFAYDRAGNKGVSAGLNNVQYVKPAGEGESLGGRKRPEDEFEAVEVAADEDGLDMF